MYMAAVDAGLAILCDQAPIYQIGHCAISINLDMTLVLLYLFSSIEYSVHLAHCAMPFQCTELTTLYSLMSLCMYTHSAIDCSGTAMGVTVGAAVGVAVGSFIGGVLLTAVIAGAVAVAMLVKVKRELTAKTV